MDSLLERIEENTLDALYLFINETLRDRNEFDRFFISLMNVLPHNWSIQRVEVGHEFLGMVSDQLLLFETVTSLEAIKTLIISDGYVPRKDKGSIDTEAFLTALPRARNLINLDIHRLELADMEQVGMLADALESMHESLEEIRLTGLFVASGIPNLDPAIMACIDMSSLRSLAMTCITTTMATNTTTTTGTGTNGTANNNANGTTSNNNNNDSNNNNKNKNRTIIGSDCLLDLFQSSSTLQDLSLRAMNFDNDTCGTIAKALKNNLFLTSLDLRQNPNIKEVGCRMILEALERNYDLWCTVMVDCESFQGRFNSLIELNQANRGDLIRNPTSEKLIAFLERLKDDPTALWYFLTIHDTVLYPFVNYLKWKSMKETENETNKQKAREIIMEMENETSKIMMMTNAATMATTTAVATTAMLTNDENDTTTMGGTMLSSASSSSSSLDSDSGIASNKKRSASPIMTTAAAAISGVAVAGNSAATMPALPLQQSQQLQLQQAVSTSKRPRTSAGSTATFATTSPNMGTNSTTTSSSRSRRTATNSTSAAGRRASLADEVSAILASHRQQPDYVEMMEHMDSRALEQEAEAILAQQRRQRLI